jgi:hypothetical protein
MTRAATPALQASGPVGQQARAACAKLLQYCRVNDWAGHDPYDALNSRIFTALPFLNSRWPRLIATQALKRSPVDLRRLMLIPRTQNPKAMALFLASALRLRGIEGIDVGGLPEAMIERLCALRSPGTPYWCWGYSFPWQTRTLVVPRGTPNLVCTTFIANALLDAYERLGDPRCLDMSVSAAEYILNELYRSESGDVAGFSYPLPSMPAHIHNANFLGAALFSRVYKLTGDARFLGPALNVARYSASRQQENGAWAYGEGQTQAWIDNFHTGYNLCALQVINRALNTSEFEPQIARGFDFYRTNFFEPDGAARYFHNSTYPIDIHCVAQSIITLTELRRLHPDSMALAQSVLRWALNRMWDERGFFYYRVGRLGVIRTSYMRWSQAWMLLALATLQESATAGPVRPRPNFRSENTPAGRLVDAASRSSRSDQVEGLTQ